MCRARPLQVGSAAGRVAHGGAHVRVRLLRLGADDLDEPLGVSEHAVLGDVEAGHLVGRGGEAGARPDRNVTERTPDGNAVSLDQQAVKMAETDTAHALAINLYRRYAAMYRTALGRAS